MSREQWGHGYWAGVEDAQSGKVRDHHTFKDEVMFWIAQMCRVNSNKDYERSLFPVREWISFARFSGLSEKYAKKVYDYILNNNFYDFEPGIFKWCYVSGADGWNWKDDYFVLPVDDSTHDGWTDISDKIYKKIKGESE